MHVTRQIVADQIADYLHQTMSLAQLVDWAELQMMVGEFESPVVRDVVAGLGLADMRAFGLTWEDCQSALRDLGFAAHVEIAAASGPASQVPN
jgi:hypothetical protein